MELSVHSDASYMKEALKQAQYAFDEGEIPVGAVIVCQNRIVARAYNQTEKLQDVTAHAEMLAITSAANTLGAKYLSECTLFVTLEPCVMCGGALYWSQMGRVVYGASDPKRGVLQVGASVFHPKTQVQGGVMQTEAKQLLDAFFKNLRG